MFRQHACEWCSNWDHDVGSKYHLTDAGKMAPVRMVDIHESRPADLTALKPVVFTPTFVVLKDGREVGRILGYPGEDFFWGLLEKILQDTSSISGGHVHAQPASSTR
ncbi:MAG: thioredoxin family protein [Hyphomicrobiales bacterium]